MSIGKVSFSSFKVPTFGRGTKEQDTWEMIEKHLYGTTCVPFTSADRTLLKRQIFDYAPRMSLFDFCKVFLYADKHEVVELMSKYLGVAFNSVSFSIQEDYLLRVFFPIFGKNTNEIINDIFIYDLGITDYNIKTSEEIQARIDYLQQGSNYFNTCGFALPREYKNLLSRNSTALVCLRHPNYRSEYTKGEQVLLKLQKLYGLNFLPWKDLNEVKYYLSEDKEFNKTYVSNCSNLVLKEPSIVAHFRYNYRLVMGIVMGKKIMKTYNPSWNSYLDALLEKSLKNIDRFKKYSSTNTLVSVYKELQRMGKTVNDCECRRIELGVRLPLTLEDIEFCLATSNKSSQNAAREKTGLKRTSRSIMFEKDRAENFLGKALSDCTPEELTTYLREREYKFQRNEK